MFSIVTAFAYITNYYVGATISFMLLVYAVIRMLMNNKWDKQAWKLYIKTALAHALGIAAVSVILLPALSAILSGARDGTTAGYRDSLLWFNWEYYIDAIVGFVTPFDGTNKYWAAPYKMVSHFLAIAVPSMVLFLGYKTQPGSKERRLKWTLLASLIFICVPIFSIMFNGGMYATHRWLFAYCMIISMIVVWAVPRFKEMKLWVKLTSALLLIGSNVALFWLAIPRVAIISIVVSIIVSAIMLIKPRYATAFIATIMSMIMILFTTFGAAGYSVDFSPSNVHERPYNGIYSVLEMSDEEIANLVRASITDTSISPNEGLLLGYNTTTGVWNVMPDGICEFNSDVNMLPKTDTDFWVSGWDDRTALQTLAGVQYYITTEDMLSAVPYGFTLIKTATVESQIKHDDTTTNYYVFVNQYSAAPGYIFTQTMSTEDFYKLNIAERQLAMMQYVIYDGATSNAFTSNVITVPYEIKTESDGFTSKITLTANVPEGYELYLQCDEVLLIQNVDKVMLRDPAALSKLQESQKKTDGDAVSSSKLGSASHVFVTATNSNGDSITKQVLANRPHAHLTSGNKMRAVNLGHLMSGDIKIEIDHYTEYINVDGLTLYAMPLAEYDAAAQKLVANTLFDIEYSTPQTGGNYISGYINTPEDGILQIAVPYSDGWTAYVDGEKVETFASGIKYVGLEVSAGNHEIRLEYTTPKLVVGVVISIISMLLIAAWCAFENWDKIKKAFTDSKYASLCRYLVSGGCTTTMDFIIYMSLAGIGLMIPVAKFTSGAITTIVSFFLNKYWSFGAGKGNVANQGWKFIITQALNICTNTLVNSLVLSVIDIKIVAFGFATLAGMTVGFVLQRFWVFRGKEDKKSA